MSGRAQMPKPPPAPPLPENLRESKLVTIHTPVQVPLLVTITKAIEDSHTEAEARTGTNGDIEIWEGRD